MNDLDLQHLIWHTALMTFVWVPFAMGAWLVDGWNTENGRVWRTKLAHPMRSIDDWRLAHAR